MDESGQNTLGRLFVVAIALVASDEREAQEDAFAKAEGSIRGMGRKWSRVAPDRRQEFAAAVFPLMSERTRLAFSEWTEGMDYLPRTAEAVVRAAKACCPRAQLTVIVDALKDAEKPAVTTALRRAGVRFRGVKVGCRDESYPLLRLADAVAGFLRDVREGAPYAVSPWTLVVATPAWKDLEKVLARDRDSLVAGIEHLSVDPDSANVKKLAVDRRMNSCFRTPVKPAGRRAVLGGGSARNADSQRWHRGRGGPGRGGRRNAAVG